MGCFTSKNEEKKKVMDIETDDITLDSFHQPTQNNTTNDFKYNQNPLDPNLNSKYTDSNFMQEVNYLKGEKDKSNSNNQPHLFNMNEEKEKNMDDDVTLNNEDLIGLDVLMHKYQSDTTINTQAKSQFNGSITPRNNLTPKSSTLIINNGNFYSNKTADNKQRIVFDFEGVERENDNKSRNMHRLQRKIRENEDFDESESGSYSRIDLHKDNDSLNDSFGSFNDPHTILKNNYNNNNNTPTLDNNMSVTRNQGSNKKDLNLFIDSDLRVDDNNLVNEIYSPLYTGKIKVQLNDKPLNFETDLEIFKKRQFDGLIKIE